MDHFSLRASNYNKKNIFQSYIKPSFTVYSILRYYQDFYLVTGWQLVITTNIRFVHTQAIFTVHNMGICILSPAATTTGLQLLRTLSLLVVITEIMDILRTILQCILY
jgi:hypothetical protein